MQAMSIHLEMQRLGQGSEFNSYGWPSAGAMAAAVGVADGGGAVAGLDGSNNVRRPSGQREGESADEDPGRLVLPLPPHAGPRRRRVQRGEAWR